MQQRTVVFAGQTVAYVTRPGFSGWDGVPPAHILMAEQIDARPHACLILGGGHGALAVWLAQRFPALPVALVEGDVIARGCASRSSAPFAAVRCLADGLTPALPAASVDLALLSLPQSRALARRRLRAAHDALAPGGTLLLAGPNDLGIQSATADAAALFGGCVQLGYRARNRVASATRLDRPPPPPPWAAAPGIAPGSWGSFRAAVAGEERDLVTLPGVFAAEKLDAGTRLLLEHAPLAPVQRALDMGCGCGVIGLAALLRGAATADLVDVNLLAVAAAAENLARHGLAARGAAIAGDGMAAVAGRRYDLILANPPFHIGKEVDLAMASAFFAQAAQQLSPGGRLLLVANQFLAYEPPLRQAFGSVERVARRDGYVVLAAAR